MGILFLRPKNDSLFASISWRLFQNPKFLWSSLLLFIYFSPLGSTGPTNTFSIWKSLLMGWNIHTGSNIRFWMDPWIGPKILLRNLISGPFMPTDDKQTVESCLHDQTSLSFDLPPHIHHLINSHYVSQKPISDMSHEPVCLGA